MARILGKGTRGSNPSWCKGYFSLKKKKNVTGHELTIASYPGSLGEGLGARVDYIPNGG